MCDMLLKQQAMVHRYGVEKGYFISSDAPGLFMKPGFFRWWNSAPVVALDLTNPEAVAWFVHRLRALQAATGIDGFKFDAGEPLLDFPSNTFVQHNAEKADGMV